VSEDAEDHDVAAKLAAFIREQNLRDNTPCFYSEPGDFPNKATVEEAVGGWPGSISERISRTVQNIYRKQDDFDEHAELPYGISYPLCFAKDSPSAVRFVKRLKEQGLLEDRGSHQQMMRLSLTLPEWQRVEKGKAPSEPENRPTDEKYGEKGDPGERQETEVQQKAPSNAERNSNMNHEYDAVFSFVGEQRDYVEEVADIVRRQGLKIFYDRDEDVDLWGKHLGEHLPEVYSKKGRYCVMFISQDYADKMWPRAERRAALDRQIEAKKEYILPVKFDDTVLPGLPQSLGYIDISGSPPRGLAKKIVKKVTGRDFVPELENPVTLQAPYRDPKEDEPEDRLSLQDAVNKIARQAGLRYARSENRDQLGEVARKWIEPDLVNVPAGDALRRLLAHRGIRWVLSGKNLQLGVIPDLHWLEIGRWRGKGPMETETFETSGDWRLRWTKKAAQGWTFKISLFRPGVRGASKKLVHVDEAEDSGCTYVHECGHFYLKVEPRHPQKDWSIVVEERSG
jgi:hypothetical protein